MYTNACARLGTYEIELVIRATDYPTSITKLRGYIELKILKYENLFKTGYQSCEFAFSSLCTSTLQLLHFHTS